MIEGAQKEMRQLEKRISYLDTERKRAERLYSQALQKIVNLKNERLELKQKLQQLIEQFRQELSRQEVMKTFSQDNVNLAFNSFARKFEELLKEEKPT